MADNSRLWTSLCDLPYKLTLDLIESLDPNSGWEALASEAGYTFERIQQLRQKQHQPDGSPTRTLLWQLGTLNYSLADLYEKLKNKMRIREMQIIEAFLKQEGQTGNIAAAKKTSESSHIFSLPHLLSQTKYTDKKPVVQARSCMSPPASENIFTEGAKIYEDKSIPGTTLPGAAVYCRKQINRSSCFSSISKSPVPTSKISYPIPPYVLPSYGQQDCIPEFAPTESKMPPSSGQVMSYPTSSTNKQQPPTKSLGLESDAGRYSIRVLWNVTQGFSAGYVIGEGAFGTVYRGTINQIDCAIKRIHSVQTAADPNKKLEQFKSELAALHKYRHENLVTLYGYAKDEKELCLVYQYLNNGSLEDRLQRKNDTPPLKWERRLNILVGACKGLNFLHTFQDIPLLHGDIKSANILLDQYFEAKIGDLGQAKFAASQSADSTGFTHITVSQAATKLFGTKAYMSPELKKDCQLSTKSDIYALAVVVLEVCSALQAYDPNRNENSFLADFFQINIQGKDEDLWKAEFQDRNLTGVDDDIFIKVLKLAAKCLNQIKKQRPETTKVLKELTDLYKLNQEKMAEEEPLDSLPNSLVIESPESSYQMPSSSSPQYVSAEQTIHNEQEQRLKQFNSTKMGASTLHQQPQHKGYPTEETVEIRNIPAPCCPLQQLPQSEAFRLQKAYDSQSDRKIIDRLSGLPMKEDEMVDEYPSDPQKLKKLEEFDTLQPTSQYEPLLQQTSQCEPLPNSNQESDVFPPADPKKMAQLRAFDEGNNYKEETSSLECDPVKLAFLTNFDDRLYKKPPQTFTEQTSISQTNQAKSLLTDQLSQSALPISFSAQSSYSRPANQPAPEGGLENCSVFVQSGQCWDSHKFTADHNSNCSPSDHLNRGDRPAEALHTEKACVVNSGKKKMDQMFSSYILALQLDNEQDCDDNDSVEEEPSI